MSAEDDRSSQPDRGTGSPDERETDWFREPTVREHRIAAGLFSGFAVFFVLLFVVLAGWWFRWVILVLAGWSLLYAWGHWRDARARHRRGSEHHEPPRVA